MADFWAMGGYAEYVWPAYAVSLLAIVILGVLSYRKARSAETRLKDLKDEKNAR